MGRKKIKIEPIQEGRNRQVTYLKRKAGLFKKAYELATLTDSQVAVIVFGHNGKLSQFCSGDMDQILLKYTEFDGIVESKGPDDFASLRDDDDDGGDDGDQDDHKPPRGGGGGGGGGAGGSGGGRGGGGPGPGDGHFKPDPGSGPGGGYNGGNDQPRGGWGPNAPSTSNSNWPDQGYSRGRSGSSKRKNARQNGARDDLDTDSSESEDQSNSNSNGNVKDTVKAAVLSRGSRDGHGSYCSSDNIASSASGHQRPARLDDTCLLAQPVQPYPAALPVDVLSPVSWGTSVRPTHEQQPAGVAQRFVGMAPPGALPAANATTSSSVESEGSASWQHVAGEGARGGYSNSSNHEHGFATLMRPVTADGSLEHSTADQLLALGQPSLSVPPSGMAHGSNDGSAPDYMRSMGAGSEMPPRSHYYRSTPPRSSATMATPHGYHPAQPALQPQHPQQPHHMSFMPTSSSPSSAMDGSSMYAASVRGGSVSSSSVSRSRPGTDEYISGAVSNPAHTPLLASALSSTAGVFVPTPMYDGEMGSIPQSDVRTHDAASLGRDAMAFAPMQPKGMPRPVKTGYGGAPSVPFGLPMAMPLDPNGYTELGRVPEAGMPATAQSFLPQGTPASASAAASATTAPAFYGP
ncbi:unnamed protein product [Parajaminaea phylloscopi]